jgi:hypothetical protein
MKQFRDTPYYVTEDGDVYRLWKFKGFKKLKLYKNRYGYLKIDLSTDGQNKNYAIHRLVAEVYHSNPDNLPQVNHIDGDKSNNHISNLEWCNNSHNQKHAYQIGLQKRQSRKGEMGNNSKLTNEDIKWIRNNYIPNHNIFGQRAISQKFNISQSQISFIVNKKTWKHI